ncbi:Competence protein ComM [Anaerolineae bacterium]|nr:Competence protein ComM [Anaerolineae bacterium]
MLGDDETELDGKRITAICNFDIPRPLEYNRANWLLPKHTSSFDGDATMLAKVTSCAVVGLDGALVDVEVYISNGQPGLTIVGLPDAAVQESRERVRAAIKNSASIIPSTNASPSTLRPPISAKKDLPTISPSRSDS